MTEQFSCTTVGIQFVFAGKYQFCVWSNGLSFFFLQESTFLERGKLATDEYVFIYLFIYLFIYSVG